MAANVHGHVILERIIEAGGQMSLSGLRDFALQSHGSDATYYTCSASAMSFDEILAFLSARGKIDVQGDQVVVFAEKMCRHEGHEHP